MRTFLGIDNGVSGAITIISAEGEVVLHEKMPVVTCLSYTKKKQWINRVDVLKLTKILSDLQPSFCMIERPMVNPTRFKATISALRCLEATEIVLELCQVPYQFIDSKEWQRVFLPKSCSKGDLKPAAVAVCKRLFPKVKVVNADSLLIAEYCRRMKR